MGLQQAQKLNIQNQVRTITKLLLQDLFPHLNASNADLGGPIETRIEYADAQASERLPLTLANDAVFALAFSLKVLPRQVLAKDSPFRVVVALFVVCPNKLPFCCP